MRPLIILLVMIATACSTGLFYDPVFGSSGSARPAGGDCPEGSTCIEVPVEGLVEAAGRTGRCEIYTTPGDPATMDPLVSEDVEVPEAGEADELLIAFVWEVTIPAEVEPRDLNPVCSPMAEG